MPSVRLPLLLGEVAVAVGGGIVHDECEPQRPATIEAEDVMRVLD